MKQVIKVPFTIIKLEPANYHITVQAKIGTHDVHLVLDTGASHSCFDLQFIGSLQQSHKIKANKGLNVGIGSSNFESNTSYIQDFSIGTITIPKYKVVLLDLQHINSAYNSLELPSVQGILGSDFFKKYKAIIDYQKKELTLRPFQSGLQKKDKNATETT